MLLAAEGIQNQQIAEQLGVGRIQVARWRGRYAQLGLAGIERDLGGGEFSRSRTQATCRRRPALASRP